MTIIHDEIEIEDFTFDEELNAFKYPCPCGDDFLFSISDILDGEEFAICPSCSLVLKVIYKKEDTVSFLKESHPDLLMEYC